MPQVWGNNATSTLSAGIGAGDVTVLIQGGHGGRFPVVAAPDFAYCTLEDASGNIEIVKVTAHTANATSFTIERAQQGTAARAWLAGDLLELRATAAEMAAWETDIDALQSTRSVKSGQVYTGTHNFTGATITGPAPANNADLATKQYVDGVAIAATLPAQAGNGGKVIRTNGATAAWADAWGATTTLTGGATLAPRTRYHINSSSGGFTLTMPATPANDDWIEVADIGGALEANNVTFARNGSQMFGANEDFLADINYLAGRWVYTASKGWVLA